MNERIIIYPTIKTNKNKQNYSGSGRDGSGRDRASSTVIRYWARSARVISVAE